MGKKVRVTAKVATIMVDEAEIVVRLNAPASAFADFMSGEIDRVLAAVGAIVIEHPYVDDSDRPLPVRDVDMDTLTAIVTAYGDRLSAPKD